MANEANCVNRMHDHVRGSYQSVRVESRSYRAADPDLLRWVHVAFMDSFLRFAIGPESPIEDATIARLHRASVMVDGRAVG